MANEVASTVVGKVVDLLFGVIKTEIGYMWNCTQNVETFENEVEKLKDIKGRVQQQIYVAHAIGDKLSYGVEEWVKEADTEISKAHEFLQQEATCCCKIGLCGNWGTLHRYGKRATTMAPSLRQLQERGSTYESCVSVETPAPGPLDAYRLKNLDSIDTHNSALDDIIAALEDESKQIIGIYGLGGVGKTTIAMEVAARVKTNLLFAHVAFINVSGTVDVEKIQKDTREATKRILKGDKVLIILDDVREELDLELCIPCGSNYINCKILLTSRNESVGEKMNAQSKIYVNSLPTKEAWILFKRVVGERLETDADLKPVAEEVAKECGGLPLLIQAVGNALKAENIDSWKSALSRLKKAAPSEIDPDIRKAFTRLQLSYDYLESEEAKSCFLLCSMFPEDESILLEDLVLYGMGLRKFDGLESIEDARDRVKNAVNILTSCGLLLNVHDKRWTKMHKVVRDMALLIASKGKNKYLVKAGKGLTEWLPVPTDISLEGYTGISLMCNSISKLPDYMVHLPFIDTFLVHQNELSIVSDEFCQCMREVKVLDMSGNNISYLPLSLGLLTKLRMLDLSGNKAIHDISILRELKDLEILKLKSTGIRKIPEEIGQLINLRLLDVDSCENLSYVTPGVISNLFRLEELHIRFLGKKGVYGCLMEINALSRLKTLSLSVPSCDLVPDNFNFETLREFRIQIVGSGSWDQVESYIKRQLRIIGCSFPFTRPIMKLIHVSDVIELSFIKGLDNIVPDLYEAGLGQFKSIKLQDCSDVTSLVKACHSDAIQVEEIVLECLPNLKLILWNSPHQYPSFCMLRTIRIIGCHSLSMLFPLSVAQGLPNLRYVSISECNNLVVVISDGNQQTDGSEIEEIGRSGCEQTCSSETDLGILVFPSLTSIRLYGLPKLSLFSSGHSTIIYPSLKLVQVEDCPSMKSWGYGSHETPNLHHHETQSNMNDIIAVHKKDEATRIQSKIRIDSFTKGKQDEIMEE